MKYSYNSICINPIESAYAVGFAVEKDKYSETKLNLFMKLLVLKEENECVAFLTLDNLGMSHDVYLEFAEVLKKKVPDAYLITACSHTHYAPSLANEKPMNVCDDVYKTQVLKQFDELLQSIEYKEIDGYVDYHQMPFDKVGSPRISKKSSENVYAGVLSIFDGEKRIGSLLFYNCHPTEDDKDPGYFSGAYPAEAVRLMEQSHPDEFFMFMQGCSGDVSSRFTRKERSFNQTLEFGKRMSECFEELYSRNQKKEKLIFHYAKEYVEFKAEFKEIPEVNEAMLVGMKEAEKNELLIGLAELKKYLNSELPEINEVSLSRISLGKYRLFFSPFELFTEYNSYIDKDNTLLIGYSNGILAYLLPLDNKEISYEYFLETTANKDKQFIVDAIKNL